MAKPDGLLLIADDPDAERAFLHPLAVERLWGVGPKTAARLHAAGIRTVGALAAADQDALVALLGRHAGRQLHALASNRDPRPVRPRRRRRSIGAQSAFGRRHRTAQDDDATLIGLVDRVMRRLRAADLACRTVVLRLRFADFERATRSASLPRATRRTDAVLAVARRLLAAARPLVEARGGLTLIGVALTNLRDDDGAQLELPLDGRPAALDDAIDGVRERFGARALRPAVLVRRSLGPAMPTLPDGPT